MTPPGFTAPPVWELAKSDGHLIAGERELGGRRFFDVRLWAAGGATATKKGITLPLDAVGELGRALVAYADARRSDGPPVGP